MSKINLDEKVFGRDSIFVAPDDDSNMSGFFSKIKKKLRKVTRKIGKKVIPRKVYRSLSRFESKHRKKLKKIGAVAVAATGAYFAGPKILSAVKGLGGKAVANAAAKPVVKAYVSNTIKNTYTRKQQKKMIAKMKKLTNEQILMDPEIQMLSKQIASAKAKSMHSNANDKMAAAIVAKEGSIEVEHQVSKSFFTKDNMIKVAVPVAAAVIVSLIN